MDEQKNNEELSNKRLLDLLTELAEVQAENAILNAKIFVREGKEQVKGKVAEISNAMQEQAKMYGKKAQELAQQYSENSKEKGNVIQEYEQALFEINAEYAKRMKVIMGEKQDLQAEEQQTYSDEKILKLENKKIRRSPEYLQHMEQEKRLASEIKKALAQGDLDAVTQKTEELKALKTQNPLVKNEAQIGEVQTRRNEIGALLEECEEGIEACRHERFEKIEEITLDKNNQLAVIPKQNIVQKIFGNLFNKINGLAKFKSSVVANIMTRVEKIKTEQLPAVKKTVQEKSEQFVEKMLNKREQLKQKAIETRDSVVEKAIETRDTVVEKAIETRDTVVEKTTEARDTVIAKATGVRDAAIEKVIGAKNAVGQGIQNIKTTVQDRANQTFTNIINRGRQAKESIKSRLQQSIEEKREKNVQLLSKNQEPKVGQLESANNER